MVFYEDSAAEQVAVPAAPQEPEPTPDTGLDDPRILMLLNQVADRMGGAASADALIRSLRTMLALYDAKARGGQPLVRYGSTEQLVNLPGAS